MRTTAEQRRQAEQRIRAAADALLRGDIPPDGKCDISTLARQAGVSRAALYRSYPHLKEEFERRLAALRAGGTAPDPRDAQITRLKHKTTSSGRKSPTATRPSASWSNSGHWRYPGSPPSTTRSAGSAGRRSPRLPTTSAVSHPAFPPEGVTCITPANRQSLHRRGRRPTSAPPDPHAGSPAVPGARRVSLPAAAGPGPLLRGIRPSDTLTPLSS
jgi:hypothetical protein